VVALIILPIVLLYQGWTYYVFRARVTGEEVPSPAEALKGVAEAVGGDAPSATT
jgi:cytochrome bd ubiquinol oxidase subunit II